MKGRTVAVRLLPPETIAGLQRRAKANNRSMEAEIRELITAAVFGEKRLLTRAEWEAEAAAPGALAQAAE